MSGDRVNSDGPVGEVDDRVVGAWPACVVGVSASEDFIPGPAS